MRSSEDSDGFANLSTISLLDKAGAGDQRARDALYERYLPRMRRWARGRLPSKARGMLETDDLVQETLLKTLGREEPFHPEHSGAFLGYVRRSIDNRIVDELRKANRRPIADESARRVEDPRPSPLDELLDGEKSELYEAGFQKLKLSDQAAIIARLEEGLPYEEIARELGKSSVDAARMAVSRALVRLAREMRLARSR